MRWGVLALLCGGCDAVFGVETHASPCGDASFANLQPTEVVAAAVFSLSWDRDLIVYTNENGFSYQAKLPGGTPEQIDLTYDPVTLSLAPEGDGLFFSTYDPPMLAAFVPAGTSWTPDVVIPAGTFAGTPSSPEFGPRRVIVRMHEFDPVVQEYEQNGAQWRAIGDAHMLASDFAPNLTPSGLDILYADGTAVYMAHRTSTAAWFGAPVTILPGAHAQPQLLDHCNALYVVDQADDDAGNHFQVRRYAQ